MARTIITTSNRLGNVLEDLTDDFYTQHCQEMAKTTVNKAPVRDGGLRGSIRLSKNRPKEEFGLLDPTGTQSKNLIEQVEINTNETAYVTAGVPYGAILEQGSSTQAPNGYMRTTVAEAQQIANRVANDL